ncbi:cytidine deaminase [Pseudonocardia acaciae]|uniref:cytidine deaminase n=1 Tax=Pseudonocardia acaciae TaxID=551276 RepID=UPI0007E8B6AF|nr:cytidine deaminase [Pseudonocardia acaciae]
MIDFEALRAEATAAMRHAYAHYSGFPVGAAALVDDGRVVTGCNVEIQLRGLTMCAENTLVGQLALTGGGRLVAFSCVDPEGEPLLPCGRCRELLHEFGGPHLRVETTTGVRPLSELLPGGWGPDSSPRVNSRPAGTVLFGMQARTDPAG